MSFSNILPQILIMNLFRYSDLFVLVSAEQQYKQGLFDIWYVSPEFELFLYCNTNNQLICVRNCSYWKGLHFRFIIMMSNTFDEELKARSTLLFRAY